MFLSESVRVHVHVCGSGQVSFSHLKMVVFTQGVNPWIEVDGGVGPKNAYKVYPK